MERWKIIALTCLVTWITACISAAGFQLQETISTAAYSGPYQGAMTHPEEEGVLTSENLVDRLSQIDLHARLSRVNFGESVLEIDIKVTNNDGGPIKVYEDLGELAEFAFRGTSNVNQLLFRLVAVDQWLGTSRLLLAADLRRDEMDEDHLNELRQLGNQDIPNELKQNLRIMETRLWEKTFLMDLPPESP